MDCSSLKKLIEYKDGKLSVLYASPKCLRDRCYLIYMIVFGDGTYYIGKSNVAFQRLDFHCKTKLGQVRQNFIPKLALAFSINNSFSIYALSNVKSKEEPDENDFLSIFKPSLNTIHCSKCKPYGNGRTKAIQMYNQIFFNS